MHVTKTYVYDVGDTPDDNGQVAVTIVTAATPGGYAVNCPNDPVQIAKTVIDVLAAQGAPA